MTKKRGRPPKTSATSSPTAISSSTGTRSETTLFCLVHKNLQRKHRECVAGMGVLHPNKVGDIFTTQPNENNIHIIVELPTSPSGKRKNEKSLSQIKFLMNNSSCGINESKINKRRIKKIFKSKNDL
ncbi:unnamed protein product [Rhizophagus irregularis]|uniref:Uncharacterized protein n=1 Tax=Rhizophagus irregularis TaxID=588596 RepID=A0A915Z822_9GLOM|nr:unnamed protein product [Rhizophagus irregularis]